jgi:RNA polymerase sigma-70 factor (ECF subfamily)
LAEHFPIAAVREFDRGRADRQVMALFEELRTPLLRYLLFHGLSPADADEALQETFLKLHVHLKQRGDERNLRGWLFQVARNVVRDQRKSARWQRTVSSHDAPFHPADPQADPEQQAIQDESRRRLHAAIEKLRPRQRECVLLRLSGLSFREIAGVLGVQVSSVAETVSRALERLSEDLL